MNQNSHDANVQVDPDLMNKAYLQFFKFVSEYVGDKKAREMARQSYQSALKYYGGMRAFNITEQNQLNFNNSNTGEREILGFGIWMYQFVNELQNFMVGVGKVDPHRILGKWADSLKPTNFFEYYNQARELKYESGPF